MSDSAICSFGIACFYNNKLLFGERKYTYAFSEWAYHVSNIKYTIDFLKIELDKMIESERLDCRDKSIELLYVYTHAHKCMSSSNDDMQKIFSDYKLRLAAEPNLKMHIKNYVNTCDFVYRNNTYKYDFPKGRKLKKKPESDQACAQREFKEETGMGTYTLLNIEPYVFEFNDNNVCYKYTFYYAECTQNPYTYAHKLRKTREFVNIHMLDYTEVSNMTNIHRDHYVGIFDRYTNFKQTFL